jgi:glycosyltransferase 2 family protein
MSRKKVISTIIAIAISALFLWLAFSRIQFADLMAAFRTIQWWVVVPFLGLTWLTFWWRTIRWRLLLSPSHQLTNKQLFGPLWIGFAFNGIFPARAGEIARPLALTKTAGVPFTTGLSTIVLERVFDGLTMLAIFMMIPFLIDFDQAVAYPFDSRSKIDGTILALVLIGVVLVGAVGLLLGLRFGGDKVGIEGRSAVVFVAVVAAFSLVALVAILLLVDRNRVYEFGQEVEISPQLLRELVNKMSLVVGVLLIGAICVLIEPTRNFGLSIFQKLPLIPPIMKEKVTGLVHKIAVGFDSLKSPKLIALIVFYSILVWAGTAASYWSMSWGMADINMTFTLSLVFLAITGVAVALPSAPGYWGLFEIGGMIALILSGIVPNDDAGRALALGYTIAAHFVQWAFVTAIGLYYAGRIHLSPSEVTARSESPGA